MLGVMPSSQGNLMQTTLPSEVEKRSYLLAAIAEATQGPVAGHGGPFGAVVVKCQELVARAHNSVVSGLDPTAHAEVQAVRLACQRLGGFSLEGCDVYASCEPCPMCLFALCWARPRAVYYAASRADAARVGFDDARFYEACRIVPAALPFHYEQVVVAEAQTPFSLYASLEGRVAY